MTFSPLEISPGIVKIDSPYSLRGRWIDCDRVHFQKGKPEKHPGWELLAGPLTGVARAIVEYDDNSGARHLIAGTHLKLQHYDGTSITNITPLIGSGTLTDPFSTTNTSTTVNVEDTAHGRAIGDTVVFDNATAIGGITIDGEYTVASVVDANNYTIVHSAAATSTAGPGGGSVDYEYEIPIGANNTAYGLGWGSGGWGLGFWGTPRLSSNVITYPRTWSLDFYGELVLANPSGLYLYEWDPNTPTVRAARVANSPTGNFVFVTNERYPIMLGVNGDPMQIAWPDQNDITDWTPSSTTTATFRRLQIGERLVAGANLKRENNVIWSDLTLYTARYTGARGIIYETLPQGKHCGLIGPHAFAIDGQGIAYWMSFNTFFLYAGSVIEIPNVDDIKDWLQARLSELQNYKCNAHFSPKYNKVVWHYVADADAEPSYYVEVSIDDFMWTFGTMPGARSAMYTHAGTTRVIGADQDGYLYRHETGLDANGEALRWFIESAPVDIEDGDAIFDVHGYISDFQRQVGIIDLTVKAWDKPMDEDVLEEKTKTISVGQGIVDLNVGARQMSIRLEQSVVGGDFRLGKPRVDVAQESKAARR